VSITSVLEAGSFGTPAVSLLPYGDDCAVLGCNMPGLDTHLITCRTYEEYRQALRRLIKDEDWRRRVGECLQRDVLETHTGARWLACLEATYQLALSVPRNLKPDVRLDQPSYGNLDFYIQGIFGVDADPVDRADRSLRFRLGLLPTKARIRHWWRLLKMNKLYNASRYGPVIYLLPEWILCRTGRFRRRIRRSILRLWANSAIPNLAAPKPARRRHAPHGFRDSLPTGAPPSRSATNMQRASK
jgi:hypothetical protein